MLEIWLLILLLVALVFIDVQRAYNDYKKDQNKVALTVHGVLLTMLSVIAINIVFTSLDAEYDLPYFNAAIVSKSEAQSPKTHHKHLPSLKNIMQRVPPAM